MKEILYYRCPVCGKVSQERNFSQCHQFEALVQEIGGRGYIYWHRDVEVSDPVGVQQWMIDLLRETADMLEAQL